MLINEIEHIRGAAKGISVQFILEHAGRDEYPEITALSENSRFTIRYTITRAMRTAGYIRRSHKSTYWFAPGMVE